MDFFLFFKIIIAKETFVLSFFEPKLKLKKFKKIFKLQFVKSHPHSQVQIHTASHCCCSGE